VLGTATPIMALSATVQKESRDEIVENLGMSDPWIKESSLDRPSVFIRYCETKDDLAVRIAFIYSIEIPSIISLCSLFWEKSDR